MSQQLPHGIEQFLHTLEGEQPDQEPEETIHVYVEPDRVTFVREQPEVIDSTPPPPRDNRPSLLVGLWVLLLVGVIVASLLVPQPDYSKSFTITVHGYTLAPVHKSITVTAQATGKGSIPAKVATGVITFYNGQPYTQIIPASTLLKGRDGVTVITDMAAVIPPVAETFPPTDGHVNVPAHAAMPGVSGNIVSGDINVACCVTSVIAQNPYHFSGGRNGQHFTYVTKEDVYNAVTPLLSTLQGQTPQLFTALALSPQCVPTIAATPLIGQRATTVSVTATVSCTAVSYSPQSVLNAIRAYSAHFGQGTLSNMAYQVIAIGRQKSITLYVTATWTPFVAQHVWSGK